MKNEQKQEHLQEGHMNLKKKQSTPKSKKKLIVQKPRKSSCNPASKVENIRSISSAKMHKSEIPIKFIKNIKNY